MAEAAKTFSQKKYRRLSSKRQHEILAAFALDTLKRGGDFKRFLKRYQELHTWTEIDRFDPPPWLSEKEALYDFFSFHRYFSPKAAYPKTPGEPDTVAWQPKFDIEIAFGQVRSPYNVGAILRLIDNFGFKGLVHSSPWMSMDHPQLVKAARGCQKWIPVKYLADLPDYLFQATVPVIGLENHPEAVPMSKWNSPEQGILVVGNEAYGIADAIAAHCEQTVRIPMAGYKKSMNVHHALAVAGWKMCKKRTKEI